jgi:hypothetical protein
MLILPQNNQRSSRLTCLHLLSKIYSQALRTPLLSKCQIEATGQTCSINPYVKNALVSQVISMIINRLIGTVKKTAEIYPMKKKSASITPLKKLTLLTIALFS